MPEESLTKIRLLQFMGDVKEEHQHLADRIMSAVASHLDEPIGVKIKINDTTIPVYKHQGDSGMDVRSVEKVVIAPGRTRMVRTGLYVEIPEGYEIQCRSRSGLATKGIVVSNSPGTIDSGYRGEANAILTNTSTETFTVEPGDRVAQWVLCKVEKCRFIACEKLSDSTRGEGGYGSTGTK